ncbi:MAG: macro domain-containing protein [candidate division WOR-3 bacterium]
MKVEINGKVLEIVKGDITKQDDLEAVVNAANAQLAPGGGVAGAIHRAAGPQLYEECKKYAPIKVSECVVTGAYNLPNRYVIHCLGPVYGVDMPSDKLLSKTYENALRLADEKGITSIGFPAISTGAFGYPMDEAAKITLSTVLNILPGLKSVKLIRFVLFSEGAYNAFAKTLEELLNKPA